MTTPSVAFLAEIRRIVASAIEASGGEVRLSEAAADLSRRNACRFEAGTIGQLTRINTMPVLL